MPSTVNHALRRRIRAKNKDTSKHKLPPEVEQKARLCRTDFEEFFLYVSPATISYFPEHMQSWLDIFVTGENSEALIEVAGDHTALLAPRGSAKTTFTAYLLAWLIGKATTAGMMLKILYIAFSLPIASAKSATIKSIISSKRYKHVFPKVRLKKGSTSSVYWSIDYAFAGIDATGEEEFSIVAAGLSGGITSKRSHLIVFDDLIKNPESIKNPDVRRAMADNYASSVLPTLFPGGRMICLGTRMSSADIYATHFTPQNDWTVIQQSALIEKDGEIVSYWKQFFTMKHLRMVQKQDPIIFEYQYQNRIPTESMMMLADDVFKFEDIPQVFDMMCVGVDLSTAMNERADYTVFTLGGVLDGKAYMIDYRRFRCMGNMEKLITLCEFLNDWNLLLTDDEIKETDTLYDPENPIFYATDSEVHIHSEAVQYQASMQGDFNKFVRDKWDLYNIIWHPVMGAKVRGDKMTKFRGIVGPMETGQVVWNKAIKWDVYHQEMKDLAIGGGMHDDCADSAVMTVKGLIRPGTPQIEYYDSGSKHIHIDRYHGDIVDSL